MAWTARGIGALLQGQMGARLVVVFLICVEQMTKVPLAKRNDMVKAIPPDRSNEPFSTSVLPWQPHRNRLIPNTHRSQPTENGIGRSGLLPYLDFSTIQTFL